MCAQNQLGKNDFVLFFYLCFAGLYKQRVCGGFGDDRMRGAANMLCLYVACDSLTTAVYLDCAACGGVMLHTYATNTCVQREWFLWSRITNAYVYGRDVDVFDAK